MDAGDRHLLRRAALGLRADPPELRRDGLPRAPAGIPRRAALLRNRPALRDLRGRRLPDVRAAAAVAVGDRARAGAGCRALRRHDGLHRGRGRAARRAVAPARLGARLRLRRDQPALPRRPRRPRARHRDPARAGRRPVVPHPAHDDPRAAPAGLRGHHRARCDPDPHAAHPHRRTRSARRSRSRVRGSTSPSTPSSSCSSRAACGADAGGRGWSSLVVDVAEPAGGAPHPRARGRGCRGRRRRARRCRRHAQQHDAERRVLRLPPRHPPRLRGAAPPRAHARPPPPPPTRCATLIKARRRRHPVVDVDVGGHGVPPHLDGDRALPDARRRGDRAGRSARTARGHPGIRRASSSPRPRRRGSSRASSARAARPETPCPPGGATSSSPTTRSSTCPASPSRARRGRRCGRRSAGPSGRA